ncbi:MAG: hypothetical protein JXP37_08415, partial [Coriobacteriia bacterium]|nr:hypothetical protein [Coriobacteriia bacterium]
MATFILNRVRSGSPSARVFSAYLAMVLIIAMAGPGLAVYAAEGQAPKAPGRVVGALPAELAAPVIEPEPVVEAEVLAVPDELTDPEVEPVEKPKAKKSVERPETVTALSVVAAVVPATPDTGARPICEGGVKLDNSPGSGTYTASSPDVEVTSTTPSDFQIVLAVYDTAQGQVFDFTSNYPVASVAVKGGDTYNDYSYDPPVYSGTGLHAPANASGYYADISHIIFCFGELQDHESHIIVRKFRDADEDGERDGGEDWLEGFTFRLDRGESETGPWAFAEEVTTAGANGQADFSMYPTGWYRITEVLSADQIAAGETPTTGDPLGTMIFYHTGQVNSEKWFGNAIDEPEPEEGDILVYKYEDLDGDGEYDDGEPMLE